MRRAAPPRIFEEQRAAARALLAMAYRQLPFTAVCRCGYRRSHYFVSEEAEYTAVGWALLVIGVTPRPRRVIFRCRRCDFVFGETTDPRVLAAHD